VKTVFGKVNEDFFEILYQLRDSIPQKKYGFMDIDHYENLLTTNSKIANKQYMVELLERIHLSSCISILRNLKWFDGVKDGYKSNNYLSFASSLRGLLESTGDTLYSLQHISLNIAEKHEIISNILLEKGELFLVSKEMEDLLIHFTHGERSKNKEDVPDSHIALSSSKYIKQLESIEKGYSELYSRLCQIIHPAKDSVFAFINEDKHTIQIQKNNDKDNIRNLILEYNKLIKLLPQLSFNAALLNLKVLNTLPYMNTKTIILNQISLDSIKAWQKIKNFITV
jgi:hypothetical protein